MSTITLTISNRTVTSLPINYGQFNVVFNYGAGNTTLTLKLDTNSTSGTKFKWEGVPDNGIDGSASNYARAFNNNFRNIGGSSNLTATSDDNVITITSVIGEFISASEDSDVANLSYSIDNTVETDPLSINTFLTGVGECDTIEYRVTANDGVPPYTITTSDGETKTASESGDYTYVNLSRITAISSITVTDSDGEVKQWSGVVARKLTESDFTVNQVQYVGYSDLEVKNSTVVSGTTPIEYSLDGENYQTDTNFPTVSEGIYTLYAKDKYGCVVEKTINVQGYVDPVSTQYNYLKISNLNSLSFSLETEFTANNKKNFENTLSYNEIAQNAYEGVHKFTSTDIDGYGVGTQVQSSYDYHVATMHNCDGTKYDIPVIQIQKNLGSSERVDCVLYPLDDGIGVYFYGGNEYEPDTEIVIGASEYNKTTPEWGIEGQIVFIDGLGAKEITGAGYDSDLDVNYFVVSGIISETTDSISQATYDLHPYNLYEFYLDPNKISNKAIVTFEAGYSFDEIAKTMVSEPIELIEDDDSHLLIEWSGYKNLGSMVFVSGITHVMRIKGKIRPYAKGESELAETDTGSYPLRQTARMGQRVTIPYTTPKIWDKLNSVSGISIGGTLKINGLELVRNAEIEQEEQGESNVSLVTMDFDYSSNDLAIQGDEIVLNVSTGVEGGGSESDIDTTPYTSTVSYDGKTRLKDVNGNLIVVNGYFIAV